MSEGDLEKIVPPRYAYKLTVVADPHTLQQFKDASGILELNRRWNPDEPFVIRRRLFPTFPNVLRMSRQHIKIGCQPSADGSGRSFWIEDVSTNGTLLNNKPLEKNKRTPLKSGDEILLISTCEDDKQTYFGLKFVAYDPENAPLAPIPEEFKKKRPAPFLEPETPKSKKAKVEQKKEEDQKKRKEPTKVSKSGTIAWSTEEEKKLWDLMQKDQNKPWKDIAVHFNNRSPDAVRNKFKKMTEMKEELEKKFAQSEAHTKKDTKKKAADSEHEDKVPHESPLTSDDDDRRRKLWTAEELKLLETLVRQYKPTTEEDWIPIAKQLRRTVKSVKHKVNDHGMRALIE